MSDRRCENCGGVAPRKESGLCTGCEIERRDGPEAKAEYMAKIGRKGAEARYGLPETLDQARKVLEAWGTAAIDRRNGAGRAIVAWRESLLEDMGGEEQVSAQELTVLELAARQKVLLDGIDGWIFARLSTKGLVTPKGELLPVVGERQRIADSLARYVGQLGLKRRVKALKLGDYVVEKYGDGNGGEGEEATG